MVPKSKNIGSGSKSGQSLYFFWFLGFLGSRFSELFLKKSIPHGSSGQTAMWKSIPYGSSSFQVFIKKCRKCWFLPIRFHFFMITLFSPFVRLRPVQAGFCVSSQTLIFSELLKTIFNLEPFSSSTCPINSQTRLERCALRRSYDENHFIVLLLS